MSERDPYRGYLRYPRIGDEVILNDFGRQMTSANPKRGTRYKIVEIGAKGWFDFGCQHAPTVKIEPPISDNKELLSVYFSKPQPKKEHGTRLLS